MTRKQTFQQPRKLKWSALSDVGRFRENNEDTFLIVDIDEKGLKYQGKFGEEYVIDNSFIFAVSDGMGGAKSGELASRIAIETITRLSAKNYSTSINYINVVNKIFHEIHVNMLELDKYYEECQGMGATLSLCWFTAQDMYFGHVGDSRIYYLPENGRMKQLTNDDTFVGLLKRGGQLNEREARTHPMSNLLNQVLGGGKGGEILPQIEKIPYGKGDRFLICSDGLTDGLWDHKIEKFLKTIEMNADAMVKESVSESGRDNTTAIIIEVLS
jgi:PPM family protein phosphatase